MPPSASVRDARDSAGCQSRDGTEKMECRPPHPHAPTQPTPHPTSSNPLPVSCRLTQTWLALNYPVSAPLSFSPLSLSLFRPAVCVCVHSEERAEKKHREASGGRAGWRAPTKKKGGLCLENPYRGARGISRGGAPAMLDFIVLRIPPPQRRRGFVICVSTLKKKCRFSSIGADRAAMIPQTPSAQGVASAKRAPKLHVLCIHLK